MKTLLTTLLTVLLFSHNSWALSLNDAKAQGLIGERSDGYLGYVVSSPSAAVKVLVEDINNKRRSAYRNKANKAGVDLRVIEQRVGERLRNRATAGHFIQGPGGQWQRK